MTTYLALFRAVNLGGSTQLSMAALRVALTRMGFERVETLLQSGNAVFRHSGRDPPLLEKQVESEVSRELGRSTEVFIRTASEWKAIVADNPFPTEAEHDPSHLVVTVLRDAPTRAAWNALEAAIVGREQVRGAGRHAYIVYPDGVGQSKLTATLIERTLGTRGTSRNWNTVRKLDGLASP